MHIRWTRVVHAVTPCLFCGVGILFAFPKTISSGFAWTPGDTGDALLHNYSLEHAHRWLIGVRSSFWDYPIFYPQRSVAGFSDPWIGSVPLYSPLRLAGFPADTSFQVLLLLFSGLNFLAAYRLLRGPLRASPFAASCGAFIFAFGSSRINQLNHAQLLPQFLSVLAIHALVRWFGEGSPGGRPLWIAVFFATGAGQIYASFYLGWLWALVVLIAMAGAAALPSLRPTFLARVKEHPWTILVSAVLAGSSLIPLARGYLAASSIVGLRRFWELEGQLPRFLSWFDMGSGSLLYGWMAKLGMFRYVPMEHEQRLGLGFLTTAVLVIVLYRRRKAPLERMLALCVIAIVLLSSMYRFGFSPWTLIFHVVPGAKAIRAVSRIGLMLLIPAAITLARWLDDTSGRKRVLAYAVGLGCLVEQAQIPCVFDKRETRLRIARLAARIDRACPAFFYAPRLQPAPPYQVQMDAMWANLATEVPTVNGYSGNAPPGWELENPIIATPEDEIHLRESLSRWMSRNGRSSAQVCWVADAEP